MLFILLLQSYHVTVIKGLTLCHWAEWPYFGSLNLHFLFIFLSEVGKAVENLVVRKQELRRTYIFMGVK
jgi:hypothetical protein